MSLIWNKPAWPFKWGMLCALLCKDNKFMNACVIISCVSSFVVKWHDTAAMANFQFHAKQAHHSILIVRNKNPNGVVLFWCRCLKWWRCCFVRWGVGICMFMYVRSGHYCNNKYSISCILKSPSTFSTPCSGSVHYFRIHPAYWQDRLLKLRAGGFNAGFGHNSIFSVLVLVYNYLLLTIKCSHQLEEMPWLPSWQPKSIILLERTIKIG